MEYIGLREFNHNLSSIIARVAAGASIVITDRGKPIVDLSPHDAPAQPTPWEELVAAGELRPPTRSRRRLPPIWEDLDELPDSTEMIAADRAKDRER
ncbi:type II toxin-antitoxin system Phd/YefM family antitoxin [Glycomyces sp. NRRL B-16210]|uniref:type II toxin-antitoxin system Phd/YefM family antitoxin n=1 Tax=Glycomyces sp. NRRL B-16210 TaxID=1463821 RepID=UPI0004C1C091|nr:type II toxin-antitoxin system prevent-host-death family antitoxin [Glycomyces sp. NRRL B-16210]